MTTAVRVSDNLIRDAKLYGKVDNRSATGQIEHWAKIGKCAEENPDLTYNLIKDILIGLEELEQSESSEYKFGQEIMKIVQSRSFDNKVKRFSEKQKKVLDKQIQKILANPSVGQEKRETSEGFLFISLKLKLLNIYYHTGLLQRHSN